jgi:hypothetical protein
MQTAARPFAAELWWTQPCRKTESPGWRAEWRCVKVAEMRRNIPAATQAALWALSSGRCYAPGCPYPVVVEIRAGVYRKNAQIGHIYGVRPGAARFSSQIPDEVRDSFTNLLLLCLPHHGEVDDKKTGAKLYPPKTLREWKIRHEGSNGPALAVLGQVDEDSIAELLTGAFSPPIERLQSIARQLEQTGTLNAAAVQELQQVVRIMRDSPAGPDSRTALMFAQAADVLATSSFSTAAQQLYSGADLLSSSVLTRLGRQVPALSEAANSIAASVDFLRRNRGYWDR